MLNQAGAYISGVVKRTVLRRRFTVISRIVATAIVLILAFGALWWGAMDALSMSIGIILFLFAAIIWFKWDLIRDASATAKNESDVPIIRLGSNMIKGMSILQQPHSGRSASPDQ